MKAAVHKLSPEEYILAALSPEDRLEAALSVAREAFLDTELRLEDLKAAVQKVRRRRYAARQRKTKGRR